MKNGFQTVTLDTSVFTHYIDNKMPDYTKAAELLFQMSLRGEIKLFASNRLFEHDTRNQKLCQQQEIRALIDAYGITIDRSLMRADFSLLSGGDVLGGGGSIRAPSEIALFVKLVGKDPAIEFPLSRTISNKFGDYDSLKEHFCAGRDVFITQDRKHYHATDRRREYANKLKLIVMSVGELVGLEPPPLWFLGLEKPYAAISGEEK